MQAFNECWFCGAHRSPRVGRSPARSRGLEQRALFIDADKMMVPGAKPSSALTGLGVWMLLRICSLSSATTWAQANDACCRVFHIIEARFWWCAVKTEPSRPAEKPP